MPRHNDTEGKADLVNAAFRNVLASGSVPVTGEVLSAVCRLRFRVGPAPGGSAPFCRWCSSSSSVRSACNMGSVMSEPAGVGWGEWGGD